VLRDLEIVDVPLPVLPHLPGRRHGGHYTIADNRAAASCGRCRRR
jgi:hypothetical protein